jgi:AcrR family transcriptional regulator
VFKESLARLTTGKVRILYLVTRDSASPIESTRRYPRAPRPRSGPSSSPRPKRLRDPVRDQSPRPLRAGEPHRLADRAGRPAGSLDEIARTDGVGARTLYRHFPTRDALVAAVYRNETEQLVAAADRLAKTRPPVTALREWLMLFVDYIATKHGMYEVLHSIVGGASDLYSASTTRVKRAIAKLVERAVASGDIRLDLDPTDLLRALAGVAYIGLGTGGERAAKHLVDILIAGNPQA